MNECITLMAAGELRDALAAHQRGDVPATLGALMSIDPESWQAIERRLASLGGNLPDILAALRGETP
ncbi:hypothetical protein HUT19_21210 [Streptomyces sp. NA02950]|uniref:hypothetical protein n=1 Tax=Streptomyces sp. NA02950 TaxID=2742137 RepID=UPI00159210AF|nr:hypothetical protein [Streptomyces sp. NA02950]QKV93964.1 hypothetical protein HUT19_21210 [Streptomyces sp. NA02950]